jgi:hypothetical protein
MLTNADVFNFLFNNEIHAHTCQRSLRLINEKNIYIFPPEIQKKVHKSWNFKFEAMDIINVTHVCVCYVIHMYTANTTCRR